MSQPNAELRHARKHAGITPIQITIPHQARVENPSQNLSQRMANGESAAAERHVEAVLDILHVALGVAPNVEPPIMIVLRQRLHQIVAHPPQPYKPWWRTRAHS